VSETRLHYRTCPFCEATCGLRVETAGAVPVSVVSVRGDEHDVLSRGYLCPKAVGLKHLEEDPDRLRRPLVRRGGELVETGWAQAFAEIDRRLPPILAEHGRHAVAVYLGNPNVHNLSGSLYNAVLIKALGTHNLYTASTVDQMPKQVSAGLMFGTPLSVAVPDVDRTDHLLVLGANPLVSNGSLLTAPDLRGRLRALRERGGRLVVVDPVRTRTAQAADEHLFILPGTDALLLFALVNVLFADGLVRPGRLAEHTAGIAEVGRLAADFTPEAVAAACGIDAGTIRRLARELAAARAAAVYARVGSCTQEFGTLASWLVDVLNVLTGNLDRPGGAMFPLAAAGQRNAQGTGGRGQGVRFGRWHSRVRGAPERYGELPVACLAEEIDTPGDGRVRALITVAGNPVLTTPDAARLDRALAGLDLMVSVDLYRNETSRHADVILPVPSPLQRSHYDLAFGQFAVRNVANYSPAIFELDAGMPDEWQTLLRLTAIVAGQGAEADLDALDGLVARTLVGLELSVVGSPLAGRDPDDVLAALAPSTGPERLLDLLLRSGPYGDHFGARAGGLTLAQLRHQPHGVDLGPLQPRIPEVLRTPSGKIELAPEAITADVPRLRAALGRPQGGANGAAGGLVLIGRRQLRSNNSWMHNLEPMVKGRDRCTLLVNPFDAARLGLVDGGQAEVASAAGSVRVPVELSDEIMAGVVSIPHGWGHDSPGARMAVAAAHAGVNSNTLTDGTRLDAPSGNAVLNGIPVHVTPADPAPASGPTTTDVAGERPMAVATAGRAAEAGHG
jgi:anaerobic selenocysteine-containing dehydrogenase